MTNIIFVVQGFSRPRMQRYSHAFTGVLLSVAYCRICENLEQQTVYVQCFLFTT